MPTLIVFMAIIDGQPRWSSALFHPSVPHHSRTAATVSCLQLLYGLVLNKLLFFLFIFPLSLPLFHSLSPCIWLAYLSFVGNWVPAVIIWSRVQLITDRWNVEHCIALTLEVAMRSKSVCQLCCPHRCWRNLYFIYSPTYLRCWIIERHKSTIAIKSHKQNIYI